MKTMLDYDYNSGKYESKPVRSLHTLLINIGLIEDLSGIKRRGVVGGRM
jgi:hypothetical protein